MLPRLLKLSKNQHFFLFGARGTGKSTLLHASIPEAKALFIDLLSPAEEERFTRRPDLLREVVHQLPSEITTVVIDEVQKAPKLLNVVHSLIEEKDKRFILTGSSARKLKQGAANLLAGRAFVYHLFPLSFLELGEHFRLDEALRFGTLPKLLELQTEQEKIQFLMAYAHTYLKEEVYAEQLVKRLDPFRKFLEVAAQSNGKIVNISNIAKDVGVDDKTVVSYFSILEDTLLGFFLEPYQNSFRKRLSQKPKFYFFDTGVSRALSRMLTVSLASQTSAYGDAFEHLVILECLKLASYFKPEYRFSYLRTKDDVEIDLIVERPGLPLLCIEIKSSDEVEADQLYSFRNISKDLVGSEAICLCNTHIAKKVDNIQILPWQQGIEKYFRASQ